VARNEDREEQGYQTKVRGKIERGEFIKVFAKRSRERRELNTDTKEVRLEKSKRQPRNPRKAGERGSNGAKTGK